MKLDPVRLKRQKEFVEKWRTVKGRGTLQAATGFGKTYTAMLICKRFLEKQPNAKILVSVPSSPLKQQWVQEFEENKIEAKVLVIHTIIKANRECDLLIIDEIHGTGAPSFSKIFQRVDYRYILGLTATIERADGKEEMIKQYCPVLMVVNMKEAERNSYISKYNLFNLGLTLPPEDHAYLMKLNQDIDGIWNFFEGNYELIQAVIRGGTIGINPAGGYTALSRAHKTVRAATHHAQVKDSDPSVVIGLATKYMRIVGERKNYLYNHPLKLKAATDIISLFPDKRIITFSMTVPFAQKLDKLTKSSFFFNAKSTKVFNKKQIEAFRDGYFSVIHSVKALDEGLNVPELNMAIILAGSSQPRQTIQRIGRVVRQQEGKTALVVEVYIKGSQEEKWLRSRQKDSKRGTEITSVHQITEQSDIFEVEKNYDRLFKPE